MTVEDGAWLPIPRAAQSRGLLLRKSRFASSPLKQPSLLPQSRQ